MVVIAVRRAVVKEICRGWMFWPAWDPLLIGVAARAAARVRAWTSSVAHIQAACSWAINSGVVERRIAPVEGPAPWMRDLASRRAVSLPSTALKKLPIRSLWVDLIR